MVVLHPSLAASDPEKDSARAEIRRLVEQAVDRLPEAFRAVFVMRDIEDMSIDETADHLGIPAATVKTRLHRARKLIRGELEESLSSALAGSFPFAGARCAQMTDVVFARLGLPVVMITSRRTRPRASGRTQVPEPVLASVDHQPGDG